MGSPQGPQQVQRRQPSGLWAPEPGDLVHILLLQPSQLWASVWSIFPSQIPAPRAAAWLSPEHRAWHTVGVRDMWAKS